MSATLGCHGEVAECQCALCVDCPYGLDGIALPTHCLGFICMIYFNVCHCDDIVVASKQMLVALLTIVSVEIYLTFLLLLIVIFLFIMIICRCVYK